MIDFSSLKQYQVPDLDSDGYIYFLFYKEVLVYIGKSESMHGRINTHRSSKMFDKVLYEECPVENLKKREKELIQFFNPILNGEFSCKPNLPCIIIHDYLFCHGGKKCFKILDGALYSNGEVVGFINDTSFIEISRFYGTYYEFSLLTGEKKEYKYPYWDEERYDEMKPMDYYFFNRETFTFVKRDKRQFNGDLTKVEQLEKLYSRAVPIQMPKLGDEYKFRFGKHNGKTVAEVRKINAGYINWFEENIPIDKW